MISIIVSKTDQAGMNVKNFLLKEKGFKETEREFQGNKVFEFKEFELITLNEIQVFADEVNELHSEFLIFASKHANKTGNSEFTVHSIGNWGKALLGGKEKTLCKNSAVLMKNYLLGLEENRKKFGLEFFRTTFEVDHHGPFVKEKPVIFIEFGGMEKQWSNEIAAKVVGETILNYTLLENKNNWKIGIGLGGTHYADNFVKTVFRSDFALSHLCPKNALQELNQDMLFQAIEKTLEKVEFIVLDYKGLNEKERIKELIKETGLEIIKTEQLTKQ